MAKIYCVVSRIARTLQANVAAGYSWRLAAVPLSNSEIDRVLRLCVVFVWTTGYRLG